MNFQAHHIYHVYNQGNNKQTLFHDHEDYFCFLTLTRSTLHNSANILAYCLMPNHFHFQIATIIDPITNSIRKLLSSYARIYNKRYNHSGSIFRQKTKSNQLSSDDNINFNTSQDYYRNCFHYIHQNPLHARLVDKLEKWDYSSFKDYAGLRNGTLINKQLASNICGYNPATFLKESYSLIKDIK